MLQGVRGGVGTTSLTAALARALTGLGERVLCLDLDPRNLLRLHFGHAWQDGHGWAMAWEAEEDWAQQAFADGVALHFLPYGQPVPEFIRAIDQRFQSDPGWWRRELDRRAPQEYDWLLIDTPQYHPGHQRQARHLASRTLYVCQADPACHVILKQYGFGRDDALLVNRFSSSSRLQKDLLLLWQDDWHGLLAPGLIHQDESVAESLACRQDVIRYRPDSQAALDIRHLAAWALATVPEHDQIQGQA